jgi:hypothetical protein
MFGCIKLYTHKRDVIPAKIKLEFTMESLANGDGFAG